MESNHSTIEEVASDNIIEREVQPPKPAKRKKKKMSFTAWWALHGSEELKMSTINVEQQDSSLVLENRSSTKALQKVDQKGDGQLRKSESNKNHQVPLKTCSEEDIPSDQESIAGEQDTVDTTEKEQPSKSEEQPPKRRRNKMKVKMIPWSLWLEKYGPAELRTPAKSTETEDDSLVTEHESISVLKEPQEKEESSKSSTEIINQNTSLPVEEGDQEDSFKTEICKEELVSFTTEPVTEKKSVKKTQKKMDQKREKQSKTKRNKKTPLLWKSFPEPDACIDLTFFAQNSDINGPLSENQSHQAGLPRSEKKTLWKMLPKSEPCIDVSFFAETIETKNVSTFEHDEVASMKKEGSTNNTATQLVTKGEPILKTQETLDEKGEKHPSLGKPMDNIRTLNVTEIPVNQTEEKTRQVKCSCEGKYKESELAHIEIQKILMKQLDDMFNINQKLNAELKKLKCLTNKLLSERRQRKSNMVSVQTQCESQDTSPGYQSVSVQTDIDVPETRYHLEPVRQSIIQQNGDHPVEKRRSKKSKRKNTRKAANGDASELRAASNENISGDKIEKEVSVLEIVGDQAEAIENEILTNEPAIGEVLQAIETVSITQENGDHPVEKRRSKKAKRKIKRKAAKRDASELESVCKENVSGAKIEQAETIVETVSEDVTPEVDVVSREEESTLLMENQETSLPQTKVALNKDEVQTPPQELELQSAEENSISEGEENPKKKKSLWKRIKKALTPPPLHRFKKRCKVHPA